MSEHETDCCPMCELTELADAASQVVASIKHESMTAITGNSETASDLIWHMPLPEAEIFNLTGEDINVLFDLIVSMAALLTGEDE